MFSVCLPETVFWSGYFGFKEQKHALSDPGKVELIKRMRDMDPDIEGG